MTEWNDELVDWAMSQGATLEVAEAFMNTVQLLGKERDARDWSDILSDVEYAAYKGLSD